MGFNKVFIIGNLGADPEMRFTPDGKSVTNFRVASGRKFNDKEGNLVEETEWFSVVVWGKMAESCNKYLSKGKSVFVEGRLQTRQYQDKDNITRYKTEVIASTVQFLSPKDNNITEVDVSGTSEETAEKIQAEVKKQTAKTSNRKVIAKKA